MATFIKKNYVLSICSPGLCVFGELPISGRCIWHVRRGFGHWMPGSSTGTLGRVQHTVFSPTVLSLLMLRPCCLCWWTPLPQGSERSWSWWAGGTVPVRTCQRYLSDHAIPWDQLELDSRGCWAGPEPAEGISARLSC